MKFLKTIIVFVLTIESRLILWRYRPFVVAVTGSVGKTSTKDAIYEVLKNQGFERKSQKSMNSELGMPLTVIGVPNAWHSVREWLKNIFQGLKVFLKKSAYPNILILELGADHPGDIKRVAKWLKPDVAVLTRVSETPVHVEYFDSPAEVFEEKASLLRSVKKGGMAIVFGDDQKVLPLIDELAKKGVIVRTFGLAEGANIRGSNFALEYVRETSNNHVENDSVKKNLVCKFTVTIKAGAEKAGDQTEKDFSSFEMTYKNPLGRVGMYPLLAAIAVGLGRGMKKEEIAKNLADYESPNGRMKALSGRNGSIIIDDTYNSSPDATMVALEALRELTCSGKKVAVLGDMLELGKYASDEHRKIGAEVAKVADLLLTVGQRSRVTAEEAVLAGLSAEKVKSFDTALDAADFIVRQIGEGDIVLVKGSQSMRMERVVKELLEDPSQAQKLLVRQEKEWLEKK